MMSSMLLTDASSLQLAAEPCNSLDELGRTPSSILQLALVTLGLATLFSSPVTGSSQVLPSLVATASFAPRPMAE